LTQFNVASSFGYKLFKAGSVDEIPFEQYRVLVALLNKMNDEVAESSREYESQSIHSDKGNKRTTYRIINED
jgi:hypothetical protein